MKRYGEIGFYGLCILFMLLVCVALAILSMTGLDWLYTRYGYWGAIGIWLGLCWSIWMVFVVISLR
jgi:hypothetical protein